MPEPSFLQWGRVHVLQASSASIFLMVLENLQRGKFHNTLVYLVSPLWQAGCFANSQPKSFCSKLFWMSDWQPEKHVFCQHRNYWSTCSNATIILLYTMQKTRGWGWPETQQDVTEKTIVEILHTFQATARQKLLWTKQVPADTPVPWQLQKSHNIWR